MRAAPVVVAMLASAACADPAPHTPAADGFSFAEPTSTPPLRGAGGPAVSFSEGELWSNCAALSGDPDKSFFHHNLVVPYRGHLVLPWSPEFGTGGVSFFDVSDPCAPVKEGEGFSDTMRESHALGFLHIPAGQPQAGDYMVTTAALGVQIWDITDITDPQVVVYQQLPDVFYPDSYARTVLSLAWHHPWLYVGAADSGVYVVDTSTLDAPELAGSYAFDPVLRVGGVFAVGNELWVSSAEGRRAAILDISDPTAPQPIPGGLFEATDSEGNAYEAYHANVAGPWFFFARKEDGGGVMTMDVSDPTRPTALGSINPDGNGGYVFYDEGFLFTGESSVARVYDARDLSDITILGEGFLPGDLDTMTPYGNVAVLSVDEEAEDDVASAVMPWSAEPDAAGPLLLHHVPRDGEQGQALSTRVGLSFNEMIEPSSAFAGSVRLWDEEDAPVEGWVTAQENVVTYTPRAPLEPGTTYRVEVLAGGLQDLNANPVVDTTDFTFTTAGGR